MIETNDLVELGTSFTSDSIRFRVTSTKEPVINIAARKDASTDKINSDSVSPIFSVLFFNITFRCQLDQPKITHLGQEVDKEATLDNPHEGV